MGVWSGFAGQFAPGGSAYSYAAANPSQFTGQYSGWLAPPGGGGGGGDLYDPREEEKRRKKGPGLWEWLKSGVTDPYRQKLPSLFYGDEGASVPTWDPTLFGQAASIGAKAVAGEMAARTDPALRSFGGAVGATPTGEEWLSPDGYPPYEEVYNERRGEWGWYEVYEDVDGNQTWEWVPTSSGTAELTDYERQALAQSQAQLAAQTGWQQQQLAFWREQEAASQARWRDEWLAGLLADPSKWIEHKLATTGEPPTTPSWLAQFYEGQLEEGAPLPRIGEELGYLPAMSRQLFDWLSPEERQKLGGYITWLGGDPKGYMEDLWYMRGKQPYGATPHEAFRQY